MNISISNRDARHRFMALHGLSSPVHRRWTTAALQNEIDRLGFVQVDSINTVARAHHMILHARNRTFRPAQLTQLLEKDRTVFENWTHDAAIIPTQFYPYWQPRFRQTENQLRERWRKYRMPGFEAALDRVLDRVTRCGPVMARDFAADHCKPKGGWWNWHPDKTALEFLWRTGVLAVARREGFQKVYDLAERVIPQCHRRKGPNADAYSDWACRSALQRLGFASPGEIAGFWDAISAKTATAWCEANLENGLRKVRVEGADKTTSRELFALEECFDDSPPPPPPSIMRIISPFDPLIRNRARARRLFGFDYRIEVFVPAAKRRYGYYVFPLLEGDRFVGRIDMKHRSQDDNMLHVTGLWPESGIRFGRTRRNALEAALDRTRRFCGANAVTFADGYMREAG